MHIFMFIIYTFVLYICSVGCSFLVKKDSKLFGIKNIIGFCTLLASLQIIYYPLHLLKLSSYQINIFTGIALVITFIIGIINLKKTDFDIFKKYEFWILFVLIFLVIKIIPGIEAGDDSFYMSLFMDNSLINSINTINPRTGLLGPIDTVYLYQGFYSLMSFIYRIQSLLFNGNIDNIFVSYRASMTLLSIIFSANILFYIRDNYKIKKNTFLFVLIQILSILLVGVLEWSHIYWGSFMLFTIFIPLVLIVFNEYLKDKKNKYVLFIINIASLSLASTSFFLIFMLTFGYLLYELYKRTAKLEDYYFMLIPTMIYGAFIFEKLIIIIPIIILFGIIYLFREKINKISNKYLIYPLLTIPIIFFVIALLGDFKFSIESYRLGKSIFFFNLIITLFIIYMFIKKEKINPILFVFSIIVIFFFNPLVAPFVSHYMTSTHVYYRLFYITKNPLVITIVFTTIYNYLQKQTKYKKILVTLFYVGIIGLTLKYGYNLLNKTILLDDYNISYNYILREDNYSRDLGEQMKKLPSNSKIFSIYFAPRIYNQKLITNVIRYPDEESLIKNVLVRVLYRNKENSEGDYIAFDDVIKHEKYNYLITYNRDYVKDNLDKDSYNVIYENKLYMIIECEVNNEQYNY